jgi:2-polyprenyl-6-methoxyphenol hydroxylase-like FAD-dependent oxidoreductase
VRIAIVGAGPAGLVAAIAARKLGLEPQVFEQAPDFKRIGGGILIHSNGLRVLDALGIYRGFESAMNPTQTLLSVAPGGRVLGRVDYAGIAIPFNRCAVVMRYELQEHLLREATRAGVKIEFGQRLTGLAIRDRSAGLEFSGGASCEAEVVAACDGTRSATRTAAGIHATISTIAQAYLRGIAERRTEDRTIRELWGADGRRFGICPLPGDRTYFFCTAPFGEWKAESTAPPREWIEGWRPFGDEVIALLEAVSDWSRVNYDELHEVRLDRWVQPPVFLVGDAAHAMTPNLGQGANCAMVDALVLVRLLAESRQRDGGLEAVASKYEAVRRAFVTRIQSMARQMGLVASLRSPVARLLRDSALGVALRIPAITKSATLLSVGYNPAEENFLRPI